MPRVVYQITAFVVNAARTSPQLDEVAAVGLEPTEMTSVSLVQDVNCRRWG